MKPRAHPIAVLRRRQDADGRGQRQPADASECIGDDLRLDLQLTGVPDVRVHAAAAQRVGGAAVPFLTFDVRQAQAARSLGLTVVGV